MSKILLKRHKRQVLRANQRVRRSEPDVRTPEQVRAGEKLSTYALRSWTLMAAIGCFAWIHASDSRFSTARQQQ